MKRGLPIGLAVAASLLGGRGPKAQRLPQPDEIPTPTPIVTIDDTRTHGPTARNWFDVEADTAVITGGAEANVYALTQQLSIGTPGFTNHQLRDILASMSPYQLRIRAETFHSAAGWQEGPLTAGLQYYQPIDAVVISPLVDAHFGVEAVVSTPWMSGRHAVPPSAVSIANGVDTELASNGWSLRPFSVYLRSDFLACRCLFVDLGVAPEVFVPTVGPTEYDGRFHVAGGWSFGGATGPTSIRPKLSLEYRGRARLHVDDQPVAYWDSAGLGLQVDAGFVSTQLLVTTNFAVRSFDVWTVALRLQAGRQKGGL